MKTEIDYGGEVVSRCGTTVRLRLDLYATIDIVECSTTREAQLLEFTLKRRIADVVRKARASKENK